MSYLKVNETKTTCEVILARPEMRNAFNSEMMAEITKLFLELQKKKNLRAVVLKGEGKVFCSGADLSWMQSMANFNYEQNRDDADRLFDMFHAIENLDVPVLGYVHGAVFGGGLGLVSVCDFVIAERNTQFCFSECKLGLAPAVISGFLKNKVFLGFMKPYMLSAQTFSAQKAFELSLIHELVDNSEAADKILYNWLQNLKDCGPEALRATKSLLRDVPDLAGQELKERTTKVIAERRVSTEGQEGLNAFLEKRTPTWRIPE